MLHRAFAHGRFMPIHYAWHTHRLRIAVIAVIPYLLAEARYYSINTGE